MLLSFELLQEAGLRLPDPVGQTASIIGALIVGQSAVEAKVVSPIAVIVVALAGICGYVMPSRDLGSAVRLCRLVFVLAAVLLGLYGLIGGAGAAHTAPRPRWRASARPTRRPSRTGDGPGALTGLIKRPERSGQVPLPAPRGPEQKEAEMRRALAVMLLAAASFLPVSGCTLSVYNNYRELERLQVIETVGFDAGGGRGRGALHLRGARRLGPGAGSGPRPRRSR